MSVEDALRACEETVRTHDPDRYFSALFAPAERRPLLHALYAFNYELARIAEQARQPMMAEIRLQWWREAVATAAKGEPRKHDVVEALSALFARTDLKAPRFEALIDARGMEAGDDGFADFKRLEAYLDASSGEVMRIAARILGAGDTVDHMVRAAGIAYGMTGLLRSIPFHAARHKLFLPLDVMQKHDVAPADVYAGRGGEQLGQVIDTVAHCARQHLDAARAFAKPRAALPAVLPAAPCHAYLRQIEAADFDPFTTRVELPLYRRLWSMGLSNLRGHI